MQILSTSPLVSVVSRWNLSSDHRHNGHKPNFPIEKKKVKYYIIAWALTTSSFMQ